MDLWSKPFCPFLVFRKKNLFVLYLPLLQSLVFFCTSALLLKLSVLSIFFVFMFKNFGSMNLWSKTLSFPVFRKKNLLFIISLSLNYLCSFLMPLC